MKKLFGAGKPKKQDESSSSSSASIHTPIHSQHAVYSKLEPLRPRSVLDDIEHRDQLPPSRSSSHTSLTAMQNPSNHSIPPAPGSPQHLKKKPPPPPDSVGVMGILKALDPDDGHIKSSSGGTKWFWNRDKDLQRQEKDPQQWQIVDRVDHEGGAELTRMIGYLTATASEDWALVLEVCERASANEVNAKEAVRALRREFKYGEPTAQLSAARLWAIMLRNSSDLFISQSTSRKFLDTLEDLLSSTNKRTSPVVRERVLDVIAAAAYASGSRKDSAFRGLWKRVKPIDKPDEGMPFDTDDAMFNPPTAPVVAPQVDVDATPRKHREHRKDKKTKNRIIPLEEDIRRLFQECTIGMGNASLLTQALVHARVEELKKGERGEVIKEFRLKCLSSQELIAAQIPWATAGAEKSRREREREKQLLYNDEDEKKKKRTHSDNSRTPSPVVEQTTEEMLLDALLQANEELLDALQQYDDLERVAMERKAEEKSRKETRMDRRLLDKETAAYLAVTAAVEGAGVSRSHSPTPPPSRPQSMVDHIPLLLQPGVVDGTLLQQQQQQQAASAMPLLAPPPGAPHGPRSPAHSMHSHSGSASFGRAASPGTPNSESQQQHSHQHPQVVLPVDDVLNGFGGLGIRRRDEDEDDEDDVRTPIEPSAKALGKRRVDAEASEQAFDPDDIFYETIGKEEPMDDRVDNHYSDSDSSLDGRGGYYHLQMHPPVHFVYDAAAERTKERIKEGHIANEKENLQLHKVLEVSGVH